MAIPFNHAMSKLRMRIASAEAFIRC